MVEVTDPHHHCRPGPHRPLVPDDRGGDLVFSNIYINITTVLPSLRTQVDVEVANLIITVVLGHKTFSRYTTDKQTAQTTCLIPPFIPFSTGNLKSINIGCRTTSVSVGIASSGFRSTTDTGVRKFFYPVFKRYC